MTSLYHLSPKREAVPGDGFFKQPKMKLPHMHTRHTYMLFVYTLFSTREQNIAGPTLYLVTPSVGRTAHGHPAL